jgi:hypothetical protein
LRKQGQPVPVAFAATNDDLAAAEVHVLDSQPAALEQPHAGPVEQQHHEARHAVHLGQNRGDLFACENDWQPRGPLGTYETIQPWQLRAQNFPVQEEQGGKRLVLRRRTDLLLGRQMRQEARHFGFTKIAWMSLAVEVNVAAYPSDIRLLGPHAVMAQPESVAHSIDQFGRRRFWASGCFRSLCVGGMSGFSQLPEGPLGIDRPVARFETIRVGRIRQNGVLQAVGEHAPAPWGGGTGGDGWILRRNASRVNGCRVSTAVSTHAASRLTS